MKKIILSFSILLLSCLLAIVVSAEDAPPAISAVTTRTDNTLELVLSISEDSGAAGCSFNVVYDSEKLTYTSHEVKETILTTMYMVNPDYNQNAIRVLWADVKALATGGEIIRITFTIKDDAIGTTKLVLDKLKMRDASSNLIDCTANSVTVVLTESSEDDTTEKKPVDLPVFRPKDDPIPEAPAEDDYKVFLLGFEDVSDSDWYYDSVKFASYNRLLNGISEKKFAPNAPLTRAMLVTVLYRLEGEPKCDVSSFSDVPDGMWYTNGVAWAEKNGIVNGVGEGRFSPDTNITREQIATIMHRYARYKGYDTSAGENTNILSYSDFSSISEYAVSALQYAVGSGLIKGKTESTVNPLDFATRAEFATVLKRFIDVNKLNLNK